MKIWRIVLIFAVTFSVWGISQSSQPVQAATESVGCATINAHPSGTLISGGPQQFTNLAFEAGEVITISFTLASGTTIAHVGLLMGGPMGPETGPYAPGPAPAPASWSYTIPGTGIVPYVGWGIYVAYPNDGPVNYSIRCGLPAPAPGPGCDLGMPISASSVMGRFLATTDAYWAPGQLTSPRVTLPAGQTAWVLGRDESGAYYKVVWSCSVLWVPVEAMGPNYDATWQGWPLPTEVVK